MPSPASSKTGDSVTPGGAASVKNVMCGHTSPNPSALHACTHTAYALPGLRPLRAAKGSTASVILFSIFSSPWATRTQCTLYLVTGLPPFLKGGDHVMCASERPLGAASSPAGGLGTAQAVLKQTTALGGPYPCALAAVIRSHTGHPGSSPWITKSTEGPSKRMVELAWSLLSCSRRNAMMGAPFVMVGGCQPTCSALRATWIRKGGSEDPGGAHEVSRSEG
mmetsp:Transcript_18218/g.44737  ORF Transcript_18218/g.44737 Transcript_18218/m.44737 type:complete len:222 (+) Transcript_18218:2354-3019(+)